MKNTLLRDILVAFILLVPYSTYSQTNDGHIEEGSQKLFARFEQRFGVLDSLIFLTPTPDIANGTNIDMTIGDVFHNFELLFFCNLIISHWG